MAIASWQLLNIYLIPPVKDAGKTIRFPIAKEFISPRLIASCTPYKISQQIVFLFSLMNDNL